MAKLLNRREFVQNTSLVVGTTGGLGAGFLPGKCSAMEPVPRQGGVKFKFSVAAYSYLKRLHGHPPRMTLEDFVAECAKMNADAVELTTYWFPRDVTPEYLHHLKHLTFRLGLDVSATAISTNFCIPPGPDRDRQLARVERWVDHSAMLGAPAIRIHPGKVREGQDADRARHLIVEGIDHCCEYAGRHGVFLALENHGGITTTGEQTLEIVKGVKSKWFGMNLDPGNFVSDDPYRDTALLAPYAINVHVKVVMKWADGSKKPTDYGRLARILKESAYRGYLALEYEEQDDPLEAVPRHFRKMCDGFRIPS